MSSLAHLSKLLQELIETNHRQSHSPVSADAILQRERHLLKALGNPHHHYPIIHITGTKGKGSVAAMSAAILQAAGYCVGLFTSPHLQDWRERFQVNGEVATEAEILDAAADFEDILLAVPGVRWFEAITALAFQHFAKKGIDIAVIETGLGGQGDATNVVQPILTAITSISYDHMHILGPTLSDIASEKAGIIKAGIPVISAPQASEATEVIARSARQKKAPLSVLGQDIAFDLEPASHSGQAFSVEKQPYHTRLIGKHQGLNAALVVAMMQVLKQQNFVIAEAAIHQGLTQVQWPGRFEIVQHKPKIVLDAAHNQDSIYHLMQTLSALFPHQQKIVVFGVSTDKDIVAMLQSLIPDTDLLIMSQASNGRAVSPDELRLLALAQGIAADRCLSAATLEKGLEMAFSHATEKGVICLTGSVYVIGEARQFLLDKQTIGGYEQTGLPKE